MKEMIGVWYIQEGGMIHRKLTLSGIGVSPSCARALVPKQRPENIKKRIPQLSRSRGSAIQINDGLARQIFGNHPTSSTSSKSKC